MGSPVVAHKVKPRLPQQSEWEDVDSSEWEDVTKGAQLGAHTGVVTPEIESPSARFMGSASEIAKGVTETAQGVLMAPRDIFQAATKPPETTAEKIIKLGDYIVPGMGSAQLLAKRMVFDPGAEVAKTAREAAEKGETAKSMFHSVAAGIPGAGAGAAEIYKKMEEGKTGQALGAGISQALLWLAGTPQGRSLVSKTLTQARRPALSLAERIRAPMKARLTEMPAVGKGVPAERFTRAEVLAEANKHGVEMTPAQATGKPTQQTIQAVGERSLFGGGKLQEFLEVNRGKLLEWSDDFSKRIDPKGIAESTEATGGHLKQAVESTLAKTRDSANQAFSEVNAWARDSRVNMADLRAKFSKELLDISEALANEPAQYAGPVRKLLEKASRIGLAEDKSVLPSGFPPKAQARMRAQLGLEAASGDISFSTAQRLRSDFFDMGHDATRTIPSNVQRYARQVVKELDTAMEKSARGLSPEAYQSWRGANAQWKKMMETYQDKKSPLYKVLREQDPVKVPQKILETGTHGGSLRSIRMLKDQKIDLNPVRVEVLNRIRDRGFSLTRNRLGGYSDAFLKELFSAKELRELYIMSKAGRSMRFEVNPSGTSNVHGAMYELHGISRGAAHIPSAHYLASRYARSAAVRGRLTRSQTPKIDAMRAHPVNVPSGAGPAAAIMSAHRQENR